MKINKITLTFDVNTAPGALHTMHVKFTPPPTTNEQKAAAKQIVQTFQEIFKGVAQ